MTASRRPLVSFVLATHNRREVVVDTLLRLRKCGLDRDDFETVVVDNASQDRTLRAVESLADHTLSLTRNEGSCAKAHGVSAASGLYIVFLDDDAHPRPGTIARMIEHFEEDPKLGAAGFTVHLPNGLQECSALPRVFHGCGVGFRADVLREVGNLDDTFFMQAEEYDLSFRLVNAGWSVSVFRDLHVEHLKSNQSRRSDRTTYYDIRNNLRLAARYLPTAAYGPYRQDWLQRYGWLAIRSGHGEAYMRGQRKGRRQAAVERWKYRRQRLTPATFETFFSWHSIQSEMAGLVESGIRRLVLADLGKNIFAFHRAARLCRLEILAVADDAFSAPMRAYRGAAVLPLDQSLGLEPDAVVVSNTASAFAVLTQRRVSARTNRPVFSWFSQLEPASVAV